MIARLRNQRAAGAPVSDPARFDSATRNPPGRRPALRALGLCLGALLLTGFTEPPPQPKPLDPAEAAQKGRELVAEILAQRPGQNFTNTGVLKIRDAKGQRTEIPITFKIIVTPTNWLSIYEDKAALPRIDALSIKELAISHSASTSNDYVISFFTVNVVVSWGHLTSYTNTETFPMSVGQTIKPFAGSDFWLADLGLEFFHWPEQRLLKSELRKTRLCRVLESINPQPATNAYSRVVSWIDDESRGILHAEAYDSQNKLLKEFDTKKFKKVNGEWQLEQMEMYNVQTRSRTQIEFNFDSP